MYILCNLKGVRVSIKRGYRDKQNLHQVILITKTNNCQFDSQLQTFNINYEVAQPFLPL